MRESSSSTFGLALLAIGIVFGDIGTSPLYAFKAIFDPAHGIPLTTETIFGSCSCVFWALMLVVTLKYVTFILRATNNNEGGIIAMLALVRAVVRERSRLYPVLIFLGLVGAALFYGDAVLTPAISVLGSILLAYTGAEALYADVGHFGRKAIRLAWFMIFPALVLSYFGQGALLIRVPDALSNPFYLACPEWAPTKFS